jgi:hypothetical protein
LGARNRQLDQNLFEDVKDFSKKITKIVAVKLIDILRVMISRKGLKLLVEMLVDLCSELQSKQLPSYFNLLLFRPYIIIKEFYISNFKDNF